MGSFTWRAENASPGERARAALAWMAARACSAHAAAFDPPWPCLNPTLTDEGQVLPESMWHTREYILLRSSDLPRARESTREGLCAGVGARVRRGAMGQGGYRCTTGCNPNHVWQDGPFYYCEVSVERGGVYEHIFLHAKHRCREARVQFSGAGHIPHHLKGTEDGIDLKLQLSEHVRWFDPWWFRIRSATIAVTTDRPGPDNRLSIDARRYLLLPPIQSGGNLVDDKGAFHFKLLPQELFLSRPVKPQVITVSATCISCENTATWDIRVGPPDTVIGFFNGVANTRKAAESSLYRLKAELGSVHKDSPLKYDWFYNQTACGDSAVGKVSCLEDVAEVFEQRSQELGGVFANRWETFWDILAGRHLDATSITGRLNHLLGPGGNAMLQWLDSTLNAAFNQLATGTLRLLTLFTDSPTEQNQADHLQRLTRHADEGASLLLVAHSQGNLFVNRAHDALKAARPEVAVEVVHVAPASPTLRGQYLLASIDLVINGLRLSGVNSVPEANVSLAPSTRDATGHGFEPTYLDPTRAAHGRTRDLIVRSLDTLVDAVTPNSP